MTTTWTWVYFQRPGFTLYQEDDKILTATAAKEYGIVDQVLNSRKSAPAVHSV